jgi:hypothetical protein
LIFWFQKEDLERVGVKEDQLYFKQKAQRQRDRQRWSIEAQVSIMSGVGVRRVAAVDEKWHGGVGSGESRDRRTREIILQITR